MDNTIDYAMTVREVIETLEEYEKKLGSDAIIALERKKNVYTVLGKEDFSEKNLHGKYIIINAGKYNE